MSSTAKSTQFKQGIYRGIPIFIGYFPIAIAFGLLARESGLTYLMTVLFSVMVYAGASQFIALNLLQIGAGGLEIVFTTLLVNLRHLLMSASLAAKLSKRTKIPILAFGITDETFSVGSLQPGKLQPPFFLGLSIISYTSWVCGTAFGYVVGTILPPVLQTGFGIALYAMFIALLVPSAVKSSRVALIALVAGGTNTLINHLGFPVVGLRLVFAILAGTLVGVYLLPGKEGKQ